MSDFQSFSLTAVKAASYTEQETAPHSTFLTWTQHLNPVSALAGRSIVSGPKLWLYYHGFDTDAREAEIRAFYEAPSKNAAMLSRYGITYIMLGPYERNELQVDEQALESLFDRVYADEQGDYVIYRVPQG